MNTGKRIFKELGFGIWRRWKTYREHFPTESGAYVFRLTNEFPRLNGFTDILYIGGSRTTLKKRLKFYIRPGPTQRTSQRINKLLNMKRYEDVDIAWCMCDESEVRNIENMLLSKFG